MAIRLLRFTRIFDIHILIYQFVLYSHTVMCLSLQLSTIPFSLFVFNLCGMASKSVDFYKKYLLTFSELDIPIKCDGCNLLTQNRCSSLTNSEINCLTLKNRNLKYFCEACKNDLRIVPELKQLVNRLLAEVNEIKNQKNNNNSSRYSKKFIIGEIGERDIRALNVILRNVPKSNSHKAVDQVTRGSNLVSNVIGSIITVNNIKSLKIIRLGFWVLVVKIISIQLRLSLTHRLIC